MTETLTPDELDQPPKFSVWREIRFYIGRMIDAALWVLYLPFRALGMLVLGLVWLGFTAFDFAIAGFFLCLGLAVCGAAFFVLVAILGIVLPA